MSLAVINSAKRLIFPVSNTIVKIFTTQNKVGYNVHYFESTKKPELVTSSINYHIYPTDSPHIYKLVVVNTTTQEKTDTVCIRE
jgi:hypothetical protein